MMSTCFVLIGKEIGDCWGTEYLQFCWRRAFRKAGFTFEKRASPERSTWTLLVSFVRGRGLGRPQPNAKGLRACLRLRRKQASFARSSWPPQSFGLREYRRPLSPGPSALLDRFRGDRPPRPLSCPID